MFSLQIRCECGFETEQAYWGVGSLFDQRKVGIPVYLPSTGRLHTHWFDSEQLKVPLNEFDDWIARNSDVAIRDHYGSEAVIIGPDDIDGRTFLCPKCQRLAGKLQVIGIH